MLPHFTDGNRDMLLYWEHFHSHIPVHAHAPPLQKALHLSCVHLSTHAELACFAWLLKQANVCMWTAKEKLTAWARDHTGIMPRKPTQLQYLQCSLLHIRFFCFLPFVVLLTHRGEKRGGRIIQLLNCLSRRLVWKLHKSFCMEGKFLRYPVEEKYSNYWLQDNQTSGSHWVTIQKQVHKFFETFLPHWHSCQYRPWLQGDMLQSF